MIWRIPIYNQDIPKPRRVFDVDADETGQVLRYYMQNIRGCVYVENADVNRQVSEYIIKQRKLLLE